MFTEHVDTPLKVLSWLSTHAVTIDMHAKRDNQTRRVLLIFENPNTHEKSSAKGFSISEAVALAQKMIDASAAMKHERIQDERFVS